MRCTFLDEKGQEKPMIMGCYGLGIGRTVAAAVEQNHDEAGIIWPLPLAPYAVEVLSLNPDDAQVAQAAEEIYGQLQAAGVEVLYDDRDERSGVKFKDADLIGIPLRVVVGKKGLQQGQVEISWRRGGGRHPVPLAEVVGAVQESLGKLAEA
jgi:prolyl-tRNA synthetase